MTAINMVITLFLATCLVFAGLWTVIGVMEFYPPKRTYWLVFVFIFWPIATFVMVWLFILDSIRELIKEIKGD